METITILISYKQGNHIIILLIMKGEVSLRPVACWDCGFESHRGHGYLSVVSVVWCQVEVSATGWSLVQRSPTECGVSQMCVIVKPRKMKRPRPPRGCQAIGKRNERRSLIWVINTFVRGVNLVIHNKTFQKKLTWCDSLLSNTLHNIPYVSIRQWK
jgi:hypothetical protein